MPGKWGSVEGTRDNMNWGPLDAAYNLAKDNGWPFRFHVLVWGSQQPTWITSLSAEEQLEEIEEWFTLVAERYPDIDYPRSRQ
jgi:endo-1,4-beta-xylanase